MKPFSHRIQAIALIAASAAFLNASPAPAGTETEAAPDKKVITPPETPIPLGSITLGAKVSSEMTGAYLDGIMELWHPGNFFLFLDTRSTFESNDQYLSSYGLGGRYLVPDHDVIVGFNAFYDSLDSRNEHHFDELGLGAEVLTHWVDARFNYYLPDDSHYEIGRDTDVSSYTTLGPVYRNRIAPNRILLQQQKTVHERRTTTRRYEYALEGWNAEMGFLVPGLDKYMELRFFAGAYNYSDFTGFKARAEARPLPGVILDLEYWEDRYLMGGHWTGELAVSVPFDIFNLARGRNPFEGISDQFRPRQREFRERMGDMVIRSHRVMTNENTTTTVTNHTATDTATEGVIVLKPQVKTGGGAPPPQVGQGEGG